MSEGSDGCTDHSQPGTIAVLCIRALAWVITHVFARGYRVAVIAPCVDRMYAQWQTQKQPGAQATPSGDSGGQYL